MATGHWLLVAGCSLLALLDEALAKLSCSFLVAGYWPLAAGFFYLTGGHFQLFSINL
jgi:hypothetical protein